MRGGKVREAGIFRCPGTVNLWNRWHVSSHPSYFDPPCGPVVGRLDGDVVRATGIPYATAGRFQPPVSAPDRTTEFLATSPAPACPQGPVPFLDDILGTRYGELPGSEDCQRLSITVPAGLADGERVPVMVWLHGGSYTSGSGDLAIFDATVPRVARTA